MWPATDTVQTSMVDVGTTAYSSNSTRIDFCGSLVQRAVGYNKSAVYKSAVLSLEQGSTFSFF